MKDIMNLFHKNHALIYKFFLFVLTTFVIVYLFPKSGTFRYSFEKGKPWQSENLYAPFDFAIKKTAEEIDLEKQQITIESPVFFDVDTTVVTAVKNEYSLAFDRLFFELPKDQLKIDLYNKGVLLIDELYQNGVLQDSYDYEPKQQISVLVDKTQSGVKRFDRFFVQTNLKTFVESRVEDLGLEAYRQRYLALFFEVIKPNAQLNKTITQISLDERLSQMKLFRGRVGKQTLIISKGEVVQGDKYAVLNSLVSEYESQVWTDSNYTLVVTAYTVLVSLALLMLLLFMKKYRIEVFSNTTKVTLFFSISY